MMMRKAVGFYTVCCLYKKPAQKMHLKIHKAVEILSGETSMLAYFVESLFHAKKKQEALGIMVRHNLQNLLRKDIAMKLSMIVYDAAADTSIAPTCEFGPLSKPSENFLRLPDTVKVQWIGSEADVPLLEELLSEPLIGVDAEWRPELTSNHSTNPSLI